MLLLIGQWYENREGVISGRSFQPFAVEALLQPLSNLRCVGGCMQAEITACH